MTDSYLSQWVIDAGTVFSLVSFILTIFLLWQTKQIKNSFLRKARLPEVNKQLREISTNLASHLQNWEKQEREAHKTLYACKGLLINVSSKLPDKEKKLCGAFVAKLKRKRFIFFTGNISDVTEKEAWELYAEMSEIIILLIELEKDSKWD